VALPGRFLRRFTSASSSGEFFFKETEGKGRQVGEGARPSRKATT
jgi:hypothetical protein